MKNPEKKKKIVTIFNTDFNLGDKRPFKNIKKKSYWPQTKKQSSLDDLQLGRRWWKTAIRWFPGLRWPCWGCKVCRASVWHETRPQTLPPRCSLHPSLCPWGLRSGSWSPTHETSPVQLTSTNIHQSWGTRLNARQELIPWWHDEICGCCNNRSYCGRRSSPQFWGI